MIPAQPKVLLALDAHEKSRQQAYQAGELEAYFYHSMCIERLKREAREHAERAQR